MTDTPHGGPAPAGATSEPGAVPAPGGLLTTADHKRLGLVWLVASFVFVILGGVLGWLMRAELVGTGEQLFGDDYARLFSLHATSAAVLFLGPAWIGLTTYLVPLQLGSPRIAFPRVHALATWTFVVGGGLLIASHVVGPVAGGGLAIPTPVTTGGDREATDLFLASLGLVALSSLVASISILVTVAKMRAPGMTLARIPLLSWGALVTGIVTVVSTPVFLSGLLLFWLDNHFVGSFFGAEGAELGAEAVWQRTLWLFGRPEIFLVALPGLAAAGELVATHSRRPLAGASVAKAAMVVFGGLSLAAWAAGPEAADAIAWPTTTLLTAAVAVPVAVSSLVWLNALRSPTFRFHHSLLYVAGFLALLTIGAAAFAVSVVERVGGGTAWTPAFAHLVAFGAPTLLLVGAVHHWAPKLFGRPLSSGVALVELLLLVSGFALMALAGFGLGYDGMPAHIRDYSNGDWAALNRVSAVGGTLVALGLLGVLVQVLGALRRGGGDPDPYGGQTLEWAAPSPPPPHNFDELPAITSATPLVADRTEELV